MGAIFNHRESECDDGERIIGRNHVKSLKFQHEHLTYMRINVTNVKTFEDKRKILFFELKIQILSFLILFLQF